MNDECRIERPNFPFQIYSCTEFFVMCAVQWIYIRFFSHSFAFSANTMDLWWLWIQIMFSILRHDRWNNLNSLKPTRAREKKNKLWSKEQDTFWYPHTKTHLKHCVWICLFTFIVIHTFPLISLFSFIDWSC